MRRRTTTGGSAQGSTATEFDAERVAGNAGKLLAGQLISWLFASVQAIVLPRYFGAEAAGHLHIGLSLWAIAGLFVAFGTDAIINRRVARGEERIGELIGSALVMRMAFHAIAFAALMTYVSAIGYSRPVATVVVVYGVSNLLFGLGSVFDAVLYGMERMGRPAAIGVIVKVVRTIVILGLIALGLRFEQVILTAILAGALSFVLRLRALRRQVAFRPSFDRAVAASLLRESRPILANRVARNVYVQLDVVIVSWLVAEVAVGWYAAADIVYGTLLFLPNVIGAAVFPAVARLHRDDPEAGRRIATRLLRLLLVLVVPIGVGVIVVSQRLVDLVLGADFEPAGLVLAFFGPVVILTSLNTVLSQQLTAMDRERDLTRLFVAIVVVAIPADIALIWWADRALDNGPVGGAMAYILTEGLMLLGVLRLLPAGTADRTTLWLAARVLLASGLMFVATVPFDDAFLLVPVAIGVVVYVALSVPLRLVERQDRLVLARAANRLPVVGRARG